MRIHRRPLFQTQITKPGLFGVRANAGRCSVHASSFRSLLLTSLVGLGACVEVSRFSKDGPVPVAQEPVAGEAICEPQRLRSHVQALFQMGPFSPIWNVDEVTGDRGNINRALGYIQGVWAGQGYYVFKRNYTHAAKIEEYEGTYPGSGSTAHVEAKHTLLWVECIPERKPEEQLDSIIIGTYFDSHNENQCADHQYSGVAALLELSRLFKAHPPHALVTLVIWPNGEGLRNTPARGSIQHVNEFKAFNPPPKGVLALQSVGRFYNERGTQSLPPAARVFLGRYESGNFISTFSVLENRDFLKVFGENFSRYGKFPLEQIAAPRLMGGSEILGSDIGPFVAKGIPGILVSDTTYFRHPANLPDKRYYKPEELTYGSFAAFVKALHQTFVNWPDAKK